MIEVLNFVFYSFWTFIGTMLLICSSGYAVARIILALRGQEMKEPPFKMEFKR